jgi:CheY-like chemotaxis protein
VSDLIHRSIGPRIELRVDIDPDLPPAHVDPNQLELALINLAVNARDAMPDGGRLSIRTDVVQMGTSEAALHPDRRPGRYVRLSVSDTGCGMNETTLRRIFEPFFTTKEVGRGTGLGLPTVYGILRQHQGWVEVQSQVGKGSTFNVFLPATNTPVTGATAPVAEEKVQGGKETILLVEDEPSLRRSLAHYLRILGYEVIEASDGREAMDAWSKRSRDCDLLFTDMVMPGGTTGLALAQMLRKERPDLRIIISSGYSAGMTANGLPLDSGMVYLPKPIETRCLARAIRGCLDQDGTPEL